MSAKLHALSRLLGYPQEPPRHRDLVLVGADGKEANDQRWSNGRLAELQNSYVRLFINALPEVPCPPYGSYYLEGTLMGATTAELTTLYRKYGLEPHELADHIAVELEFLAFVLGLPPGRENERDRRRLLNHLKNWLPEFCQRVQQSDNLGFYKALAKRAEELIAQAQP